VEDSGNYKLSISNPFGTTVSDPISVLVHNTPPPPQIPPKIAASQDRLTVVRGNPFVLSISILAGTPPFEYHWLSDHPAGNATTSYSVEHAQFSDTGQYYVNVTNPYG